MDPYDDSDPAYAATPLLSSTDIPTIHNCPRVRFQQVNNNNNRGGPNFPFGSPPQVPLRYDPQRGLHPQGYGHPPNPYQPHQPPPHHFQPPPQPSQSQLMRPMIPPVEFIDQHLDVFQATSYDLPEGCFKIETGPAEEVDLNMFCLKDIVETLLDSKKKLREVPQEKFSRARQRCNPYELVGSSIFMNRASVKLASIDSQLALTATKEDPSSGDDEEISKTFRFADLCSGPGGFSEYLLWRKHTWGERARGWAITLKGDLDFALDRFHRDTAVADTLKTFYGADGTGNLLKTENIEAFADLVEAESSGFGVGLVSADGGISVDGDEAVQETLLQRLILCQILTMFKILQKGGDFVVKIFDIFTPVTAGLVWILSRHFEKICVVKPLTSRPMNSERYVVCRHLLERKPSKVIEHLTKVNAEYQKLEDKAAAAAESVDKTEPVVKEDMIHVLDLKTILLDGHFMEYIKRNNMKTAIRQTEALDVFLKYVNEGIRPAFDQEAIKKVCLQEWRIPPRPQPVHPQYHQQQQQLRQMQHQQHPHQNQQHHNPYQQQHHSQQRPSHHPQHQHRSGPPPGHHPYNNQHPSSRPPHHQQQHLSRGGGAPGYPHQHQGPPGSQRPGNNSSVVDSILGNIQPQRR